MDPEFGVGLYRFLFEADSPNLQDRVEARIMKQVELYMPFLQVHNIDSRTSADNKFEIDSNSFYMSITYSVLPLNLQDQLDISLKVN